MSLTGEFEHYLQHEKRFSIHTVIAYMKDLAQFKELSEVEEDNAILEVNHQVMRRYLVSLMELDLEIHQ